MSLIDAEMSRLKGEIRLLTRERDAVRSSADDWRQLAERDAAEYNRRQAVWLAKVESARQLAEHFIRKVSLITMRCEYCWKEWVRDCPQEHDADCPVGHVLATLAAHGTTTSQQGAEN